jgi:deoxyribodipyrimidine photo-lyase
MSGGFTIRIHDPVKQGYDHDPTGEFVRRWLPELSKIIKNLITRTVEALAH